METAKNPRRLWPIFLGGIVLIFLFALAVRFLIATNPAAVDDGAARAAERTKAYADLVAENTLKLGNYAWTDKAKGHVQIPIDRAMELTLVQLNARPPAPAGPVVPPVAVPAAPAPVPPVQPPAPPAAQPGPVN